jgi:hypothetical protein
VTIDTSAYTPTFTNSDQKTPWVSVSSPVTPSSDVGLSHPISKGPRVSRLSGTTPSLASAGRIRV